MSDIGILLRPSRSKSESDPGHIVVMWSGGLRKDYRGFVFDPSELPREYRQPSKWREYLFDNSVPGYVRDERIFVEDDYSSHPDKLWYKHWDCPHGFIMLEIERLGPSVHRYSFNPGKNSWSQLCDLGYDGC